MKKTAKRGSAIQFKVAEILKKVDRMYQAIGQSTGVVGDLDKRLSSVRNSIMEMDEALNGNRSKMQPGRKDQPYGNESISSCTSYY